MCKWLLDILLFTRGQAYAKAKAAGEVNKIPSNHSPYFAPVIPPTLQTGVETLVVAALARLSGRGTSQ